MELENFTLNRIDALLKKKGWTKYRLSKESDVPYATITHMYKRNTVPSMPTLERLCHAFNVSMAQFFYEGKGVIEMAPAQRELLECYNRCGTKKRELILKLAKDVEESAL